MRLIGRHNLAPLTDEEDPSPTWLANWVSAVVDAQSVVRTFGAIRSLDERSAGLIAQSAWA